MYTPVLIGLINNMDHMRISGTEPSLQSWKAIPKQPLNKLKPNGIV